MERHQAEGKFNVMLPVIRLHGESSDSLRILLFILAVGHVSFLLLYDNPCFLNGSFKSYCFHNKVVG